MQEKERQTSAWGIAGAAPRDETSNEIWGNHVIELPQPAGQNPKLRSNLVAAQTFLLEGQESWKHW